MGVLDDNRKEAGNSSLSLRQRTIYTKRWYSAMTYTSSGIPRYHRRLLPLPVMTNNPPSSYQPLVKMYAHDTATLLLCFQFW